MRAADDRGEACAPYAYDIVKTVLLRTGEKAYYVQLADKLKPKYGVTLPDKAFIRLTDYQGMPTGVESIDCTQQPSRE